MSWRTVFQGLPIRRGTIRARLAGLLGLIALVICGCSSQRTPLEVQLTQIGPYTHAARPPDCQMKVLPTMPIANYRQVAIVEAWADLKDKTSDVLPALQRKACETGADALVLIGSEHQDIKNLLYKATPNEQMNETTESNVYSGAGAYIKQAEHTRRIGEAGHNGYYVEAIAITFQKPANNADNAGAPPNG